MARAAFDNVQVDQLADLFEIGQTESADAVRRQYGVQRAEVANGRVDIVSTAVEIIRSRLNDPTRGLDATAEVAGLIYTAITGEDRGLNLKAGDIQTIRVGLSDLLGDSIVESAIERVNEAIANADGTEATSITELSSRFGENVAATNDLAETKADEETVQALRVIRVVGQTASGKPIVAGIGLGTDGETSEIVLSAANVSIFGEDGEQAVWVTDTRTGRTVLSSLLVGDITFTKLTDDSGNLIAGNGRIQADYIESEQLVIGYSQVEDGPPSNADVTGENTANDVKTGSGKAVREAGADRTSNNTASDVQTGSGKAVREAGADKTSNNVAKAIEGQKAFATLDKITRDNIAAYLESAAISRAYLGEASVGTLQIGGNAVTRTTTAQRLTRKDFGRYEEGHVLTLSIPPTNTGENETALLAFSSNYEFDDDSATETASLRINSTLEGDIFNEVVEKDRLPDARKNFSLQIPVQIRHNSYTYLRMYMTLGGDNVKAVYFAYMTCLDLYDE